MIGQGAVWPHLVVVLAPALELVTHVGEREEHLHVQALIAQPSVKGFDIAVLDRLARPDEVEVYAVLICPHIHGLACELGAIVRQEAVMADD